MKAGKYTIKELFDNRQIEQIIIPEIQRDYIWGKEQVEGLLQSIVDDFKGFKQGYDENGIDVNKEILKAFIEFYMKEKHSANIGFIYAYNDSELPGKYFLIDGQQRLTTIYLTLLVLAAEMPSFKQVFDKRYTFNSKSFIDYRVRETAHDFMNNLVSQYTDLEMDIQDQNWYHSHYQNDKTICSVIDNIQVIKAFLSKESLFKDDFADYLQNKLQFWYFDTNISEQGEELYIYMNARGEAMQENENLKADFLGQIVNDDSSESILDLKNNWGKKWEDWQNFFWINRNKNKNADNGFNEFVNCIAGLINYTDKKGITYSRDDFEGNFRGRKKEISYSDLKFCFEENALVKIENLFEGLNYIFDQKNIDLFKKDYQYCAWVDSCLSEILNILNSEKTNWFAKIDDPNRGLEHSRMVFIWSILMFMSRRNKSTTFNPEIYRVLRVIYLRFKNYNRSILNLENEVTNLLDYGPWKVGFGEEIQKNSWLAYKSIPDEVKLFEEVIWEIEDHPLNIDGRDVGAINSSHLIDFSEKPNLEHIRLVRDKFYELFPIDAKGKIDLKNENKLINTLLFYGSFWEMESPYYYSNYHFGNWKKIIRNINSKNVFSNFFIDYLNSDFANLMKSKIQPFDLDKNCTEPLTIFRWYASKLGERMWSQGKNIAIGHYNYQVQDYYFPLLKEILNTKGDLKGGTPAILFELV